MFLRHTFTTFEYHAVAGVLLGAGFLHPFFWPLPVLGAALWTFASMRTARLAEAFYAGWILGVLKMSFVLLWILSVRPDAWSWTGSPVTFLALLSVLYIVIAGVIGLGSAAASGLFHILRLRSRYSVALFPFLVVFSEICGAFLFSLLALGPGSTAQTFFSFGHIGYVLVEHGILRGAAVYGGVYTLSFLVALLGMLVLFVYIRFGRIVAILLFGIIVTTSVVQLNNVAREESSVLKEGIALVGTQANPLRARTKLEGVRLKEELTEALTEASRHSVRYIVLPEDMRLSSLFTEDELMSLLQSNTAQPVVLIDSARTTNVDGKVVLRASLLSGGVTLGSTEKRYLVPLGEYTPYLAELFRREEDNDRAGGEMYIPGEDTELTRNLDILFCSESLIPILHPHTQSTFTAHLVSHAWFKNSDILEYQSQLMVRVHALVSKSTVGVAGNAARTYLIGRDGVFDVADEVYTFGSTTLSLYTMPASQ